MSFELVASSVVIVANKFNPSIFTQLWLVRNEIVAEDDFRAECVFTDEVVKVESREFALLVIPPQLQFVPNVPDAEQAALVWRKIGTIVRSLPHTPYTALGLNFHWRMTPESGDIKELESRLFGVSDVGVRSEFGSPDARFGAYCSKDWRSFRLKLDIKPLTHKREDGTTIESLNFAFNYHADIKEGSSTSVAQVEECVSRWDEARNYSNSIMQKATESNV